MLLFGDCLDLLATLFLLMVSFQPLHICIYIFIDSNVFCCTSRSITISNSVTVGPGPP